MLADLLLNWLSTKPPFINVGLNIFKPWPITTRTTRGRQANSRHWAVLFTCLSIRAVHIEVIKSMDTFRFMNTLTWFLAVFELQQVTQIRSGETIFVEACKDLGIGGSTGLAPAIDNLLEVITAYASHMGGAWECTISIAYRILDSMQKNAGPFYIPIFLCSLTVLSPSLNGRFISLSAFALLSHQIFHFLPCYFSLNLIPLLTCPRLCKTVFGMRHSVSTWKIECN